MWVSLYDSPYPRKSQQYSFRSESCKLHSLKPCRLLHQRRQSENSQRPAVPWHCLRRQERSVRNYFGQHPSTSSRQSRRVARSLCLERTLDEKKKMWSQNPTSGPPRTPPLLRSQRSRSSNFHSNFRTTHCEAYSRYKRTLRHRRPQAMAPGRRFRNRNCK